MTSTSLPQPPRRFSPAMFQWLLLIAVLMGSSLLKLHHLSHAAVKPLDEVFHAIVARNLMRHPLTPTLVDQAWLPFDVANWQANHVWLHKPPMALWQIALCFKLLGVSAGSLRLPSILLSAAAAGLTYAIGVELLDGMSGLIAATLQAFNPVIGMLVHGYVFSDHVDISLLFWTELAVYGLARFLRCGRRTDLLLCGFAQGLAFLSKTWPALVVSGIAGAAWLLPQARLVAPPRVRVTVRSLAWIMAATAVVVLPWYALMVIRFPTEYATENLEILHHLNSNIEGWAGPWDRLVFDYWISIFYSLYPAVLVAAMLVGLHGLARREMGPLLVLAWAVGVMGPNLLATSKTMSATLIGWPAMWLLLGKMISLAWEGEAWAAVAWGAAVVAAMTLRGSDIPTGGWGFPSAGGAGIWRQHSWVIWHVLLSSAAAALAATVTARWERRPWRPLLLGASLITVTLMIAPAWWRRPAGYGVEAWRVVQLDRERPAFLALGRWGQHLPNNAAFVVDEGTKLENKLVEFATDRSCYALSNAPWESVASQLVRAGALPYLVTPTVHPLPLIFLDSKEHRFVYACTSAGVAPAVAAAQAVR